MFSSLASFTLLALSLPFAANAEVHRRTNHHQQVAKARSQVSEVVPRAFTSARWSFYDVGLGACGKVNGPSDFIVALNSAQFGGGYPGPHCFATITMNYNGKSAQATIMDECPGCPFGGLDLSRGLFTHFASEDTGIIYGEWSFNDGSGGGGGDAKPATTSKYVPPKTTKKSTTKEAPPTSTYTPPAPTTSKKSTTIESTTSKTSLAPTTSTASPTTSTSVSTSSPASTVNPALAEQSGTVEGLSNLNDMTQVLVGMAGIVLDGAQA